MMGALQQTLGVLGTVGARSNRFVPSPGWDPRAVRRWLYLLGHLGSCQRPGGPPLLPAQNPEWGGKGSPHVGKN